MFETEEVTLYPKAEPNDKIALIDADTIAYGACCACEYQYYDIEANEDKYAINLNDAVDHAIGGIQQILDQTGCKTCELYFTSDYNFRYDVDPNYKANRVGLRRPEGLDEIKVELLKHYSGMICTEYEADDMVAYKAMKDYKIKKAELEELNNLADSRVLSNNKKISGHHSSITGKSKVYSQWDNMLDRCYGNYKPSIAHYQDNSIKVYKPWVEDLNNYITWVLENGWFEGCSIDRIDYLGHYIPSNIQFVSKSLNTKKQNLVDNPKSPYPNTLEYIVTMLGESNIKFKYKNIYYEIINGKAEVYRNFVMCAVDKDLLKSIPGKHFNYYSSDKHNIQPKFVEVEEAEAIMFNYLQAIMGDSSDGIKGVPGIGPKKAKKFLNKDMSELEMWEGVVKAYESKGLTFVDALTTMRLVSIKQLKRQEDDGLAIELFDPFKELGYGNEIYEE